MLEINISRLVDDVAPFDLSSSIAERGQNAGRDTWQNAQREATERPLLAEDERDEAKRFFAGFGAWDDEEIAAWSNADLDALVLQYAAGDLREVQSLCPGEGLADVDWIEAEELAHAGTISGNLFASGDCLYISLSE